MLVILKGNISCGGVGARVRFRESEAKVVMTGKVGTRGKATGDRRW